MVRLTVKITLRFQVSVAHCGDCLGRERMYFRCFAKDQGHKSLNSVSLYGNSNFLSKSVNFVKRFRFG